MRRSLVLRIVIATLLAAGALANIALAPPAAAANKAYTARTTVPAPPSSSFSGASGGGDGWAVAMTPTAVYNVFHHSGALGVNCHLQVDASDCWASPKTITDAGGGGFSTPSQPGLYIHQPNGHMFTYAERNNDGTPGVVCIDTTQPAGNANPFCGFTATGPVGSSGALSSGIFVASKFYAFNFYNGAAGGAGKNQMMCFDPAAGAACASQPFAVALQAGNMNVATFPSPSISEIAGRIIVPVNMGANDSLACFDTASNGNCAGSWPASLGFSFAGSYGAPFPLLSAAGAITGLCLPTGSDPCFSLAGGPLGTPANLPATVTGSTGWNGPSVLVGSRVYVPMGGSDVVACFDYSSGASCSTFPKAFAGLSYLYTVNKDPQRPECLWVNADGGSLQIQNFDAFAAGGCGAGPVRVLASNIVPTAPECIPVSYQKLQVIDPARSGYTSGTVAFRDGSGNPIAGAADAVLDATGSVSLVGLNLGVNGLPQFLITLSGLAGPRGPVTVELTWTGPDAAVCGGGSASVPTTNVSDAAIVRVLAGVVVLGVPVALGMHLTQTSNGAALSGKTIRFTNPSTGATLCTAVTDVNGYASCRALSALVNAILSLGYNAVFDGSPGFLPSSSHGPIVQIGSLKIR